MHQLQQQPYAHAAYLQTGSGVTVIKFLLKTCTYRAAVIMLQAAAGYHELPGYLCLHTAADHFEVTEHA